MIRVLGALLLCASAAAFAGTTPPDLVAEGTQAYREGRFADAIDRYERAVQAGAGSADVHYNLGNAYYKLGRSGAAILSYEKALSRDPGHEDARANLAVVERRLELEKARQELGIPHEGFWARMNRRYTPNDLTIVFLILYYALFGALMARQFLRPRTARTVLGLAAATLGALTLTAGAFFAYRVYLQERVSEGIVLQGKVALMEPHGESWKSVRMLPEGLRLRILTRNEGWVQVRLAGGLSGYVKEGQVGEI
jgi:tetratricopeptide (TPR) repeat protein